MTIFTWIAIAILGPGAIGLFAWFLHDFRALVAEVEPDGESGDDSA